MAVSATTRPMLSRRRLRFRACVALTAATFGVGCWLGDAPAHAQNLLQFPEKPPARPKPSAPSKTEQPPMLLQATEMNYDYKNKQISAVGNVQIYHGGATLEANKVTYDETTKRLHAEGNVRLTEPDGKITYGEVMNLSDNFRDGFVDSLRLDSPDQTRMAATRADRTGGNFTVFQGGVYTACEACKDDPKKPPLWQVTAARIVHDEGERMIYFENAKIEFFGRPIAYLPYFSAPDPTVKRKTGFLMPTISSTGKYGVGIESPYYWALAPDYDFTFSPLVTTKQGLLLQGEYRQRFTNGVFNIRGAGIYQLSPGYFKHEDGTPTPGYRDWRGALETSGQFALNDKWVWGFDGVLPSDRTFFQDYNLSGHRAYIDPFKTGWTEGVSQLYITGKGDRSFFDTRAIHYYGFSEADVQSQLPVIHPVLDYNYTFANPIAGGELSYRINLTSLSREQASLDPITWNALNSGQCGPISADPAVKTPANCLMRGMPGTYTRASTEVMWKKSITDAYGQIFTPFLSLRADAASFSVNSAPGVSNYLTPGEHNEVRAMPTAGIEYRYPFISAQPWGTQTLEPIAQIIVRPNEQRIGKLPNEDAQSLIFDDSNLFRYDKFSGWDRSEGGGRANVGVQYTAQFNRAGFVNALFGQSYHLFGTNSFAVSDINNTGIESGLDSGRSDYVARVSYQPDKTYTFTTRYRFDEQSFAVRRFEAEVRANYDRWNVSVLYGQYDAQPLIGYLTKREGVLGQTSIKLNANWVATMAARYDLDSHRFDQTQFGIGYIDDCFILGLNYITNYAYSGNPTADHRLMLQLSLRTIGGTSFGQSLGGL